MNCTECDCSNGYHADGCPVRTGQPTLRQRYAMAALTGILAHGAQVSMSNECVRTALRIADAMLAAERAATKAGEGET